MYQLTKREESVVAAMRAGKIRSREIAAELGLRPSYVKGLVSAVIRKVHAQDRRGVVAIVDGVQPGLERVLKKIPALSEWELIALSCAVTHALEQSGIDLALSQGLKPIPARGSLASAIAQQAANCAGQLLRAGLPAEQVWRARDIVLAYIESFCDRLAAGEFNQEKASALDVSAT